MSLEILNEFHLKTAFSGFILLTQIYLPDDRSRILRTEQELGKSEDINDKFKRNIDRNVDKPIHLFCCGNCFLLDRFWQSRLIIIH